MAVNIKQDVVFTDPRSMGERTNVAESCVRKLGIEIPALLDSMDNTTEAAYTGWPDRIYVIDASGAVFYKSQPGPFGFSAKGLESALARIIGQTTAPAGRE